MSEEAALIVRNVNKTFYLDQFSTDTLRSRVFHFLKRRNRKVLLALRDINFEVRKGENLGIIGRNGSGKSTLVKIMSGSFVPDRGGEIVRIGSSMLMNLHVGMSHELTAGENIYVTGSALGLPLKKIDKIFDDIVAFAELEEFINTKVKYFSSGMIQRLSFAIAVNAHADIIFLDEVFAVGDTVFKKKAVEVLQRSWMEGKTTIMVSHSMNNIRRYCQRVLYLKKGEVAYLGDPETAIKMYLSDNSISEKELAADDEDEGEGEN